MFEPSFKPYGPFPTAEWAVWLQPEHFAQVVPWFMQRRHVKGRIDKAGTIRFDYLHPINAYCSIVAQAVPEFLDLHSPL
jgi:hypothetical protein